jgi:molecular chaperone GrpE
MTEKHTPPPAETEEEKPEGDLEAELTLTKDHLLRALADAENLRKRTQREKEELNQYAITNFARDMLAIADNLSRAIQPTEGDAGAFLEGVKITEKELLRTFEKYKIKPIEALGQPFDPHLHQAVVEIPTDESPAGTIVQVIQTGYTIGDRLLRPAMVGVAKIPG